MKNSAANEEGGEGGASHWNAIIAEADSRDRLEARVVWHGVLEKNSGNMLQGFHERHFLLTSHELTYCEYWCSLIQSMHRHAPPRTACNIEPAGWHLMWCARRHAPPP